VSTRKRLLAWLAGIVLVTGSVLVLKATDDTPRDEGGPEVRVDRFASNIVVLPTPGRPPAPPGQIIVTPGAGTLRLSWADGLVGRSSPESVAGYEIRWHVEGEAATARRLVAVPDVQLNGLSDGRRYRIAVRSVDAYGQRSRPAEVTGVPGHQDEPETAGLTGMYDDFADPATALETSPDARWHVSGYRGCVGLGAGRVDGRGLPIDLGCGADMAVMRSRTPMRLTAPQGADQVLGRVAVRTDAAGPGGELTVDLVPGRADRVGVGVRRASRTEEADAGLPGGTIRVLVADTGVQVSTGPGGFSRGRTREVHPPPRRGPGVVHLFEVVLTSSGVRVYQDGLAVAARDVVPRWREASVLLGFRGPDGRRSRVHVSSAGFTGPEVAPPRVVETSVNAGTQQVLGLGDKEPGVGIARTPLLAAKSARVVATLSMTPELDPRRVVVQLGGARVPARPVVAAPSRAPGAALTVVADVPRSLLGAKGPDSITPFVLRAPGASTQSSLLETYLEITPGPGWSAPAPDVPRPPRLRDALPAIVAELANAAGQPLQSTTVPRRGQLVLNVVLRPEHAQWDTGAVAGVQGLQVRLDGSLIASIPTAADGPGVGGTYALSVAMGGLSYGPHAIEVREYGMGSERPVSALLNFVVR
jgi:hypothetical protein